MSRLARFSDCVAKFCKETGKPGPCADPNSKRQQRMKGLGAAAKAKAPAAKATTPKAAKVQVGADAGKKAASALASLGDSLAGHVSKTGKKGAWGTEFYKSTISDEQIAERANAATNGLNAAQLREAARGANVFMPAGASKAKLQTAIVKSLRERIGALMRTKV